MKKFSILKKDFIIKGFTNIYKNPYFFFCLMVLLQIHKALIKKYLRVEKNENGNKN